MEHINLPPQCKLCLVQASASYCEARMTTTAYVWAAFSGSTRPAGAPSAPGLSRALSQCIFREPTLAGFPRVNYFWLYEIMA